MPKFVREWWFWGLVAVGVVIYLRQKGSGGVKGNVTLGEITIKPAT